MSKKTFNTNRRLPNTPTPFWNALLLHIFSSLPQTGMQGMPGNSALNRRLNNPLKKDIGPKIGNVILFYFAFAI
jgi:hypothetical protein